MDVEVWLLIGLVALVNAFYFIPGYLIDQSNSSFFPRPPYRFSELIIARDNLDPWRLQADLFIFLAIIRLADGSLTDSWAWSALFTCLILLGQGYQVYDVAFTKIYHVKPNLFHDQFMLTMAARLVIHDFKWRYRIVLLGLALYALCIFVTVRYIVWWLHLVQFSEAILVICAPVLLLAVVGYLKTRATALSRRVVPFTIFELFQNTAQSWVERAKCAEMTLSNLQGHEQVPNAQLLSTPDFVFVVVESYGRVIFDDPRYAEDYVPYLQELEAKLDSRGIACTSCFTVAPVLGGASWLSYTSILYGLRVDGHGKFLRLLNTNGIDRYNSMFNWLRRQGYTSYRASGLGGYKSMKIPYDKYSKLYGVDHWITHDDLNFQGHEYGFGPSPPDQFTLNFALDRIKTNNSSPFALFFISQNSHSPFDSPHEVVENWRELNSRAERKVESTFWAKPPLQKYEPAIRYQLNYLTDVVCRDEEENTIYIFIGDHQPPGLNGTLDNFQTPMHIISRDRRFIEYWNQSGMVHGMVPDRVLLHKQESLLSLFRRAILATYGSAGQKLPAVRANGMELWD